MNIILFNEMPKNSIIPLSDERACHIVNILHLKEGDSFKMGIVDSSEGIAQITKIDDEGVHISYKELCKPSMNPVTLLVAQVRPICMKRILRDAVSIGCSRIILCGSDTGEKSYLSSNLYKTDEYKDYLLDGAMQSGHAAMSKVFFADNVKKAIEIVKAQCPEETRILLDNVKATKSLKEAKAVSAVLAIGPERGWSDRERSLFEANGFESMLLGPRILRTETAVCCGLSVLLSSMNLM